MVRAARSSSSCYTSSGDAAPSFVSGGSRRRVPPRGRPQPTSPPVPAAARRNRTRAPAGGSTAARRRSAAPARSTGGNSSHPAPRPDRSDAVFADAGRSERIDVVAGIGDADADPDGLERAGLADDLTEVGGLGGGEGKVAGIATPVQLLRPQGLGGLHRSPPCTSCGVGAGRRCGWFLSLRTALGRGTAFKTGWCRSAPRSAGPRARCGRRAALRARTGPRAARSGLHSDLRSRTCR